MKALQSIESINVLRDAFLGGLVAVNNRVVGSGGSPVGPSQALAISKRGAAKEESICFTSDNGQRGSRCCSVLDPTWM